MAVAALACWPWQEGERHAPRNALPDCPLPPDARRQATVEQPCGFGMPRARAGRGLLGAFLIGLALVLAGCAAGPRPDYPRPPSTAFEDHASTRLGQFFGPAADEHPGLSGFSLMSQGREAFIIRLALADLAERSLDMQYYIWDGDTTGRIILDHVMRAAERGVRVRLLVDDPYYKDSDAVIAALDAHPDVEIRLFNSLTNRGWSALDFVTDFGRVNRRMHNKLMVADNAAAIVGGRNIGDIYYGVNTAHNYRDLDVLAVGPVVRDLSGVFDRYWNGASAVPIGAIVDRAYGPADLDAIRVRLDKEIAAADYPYPIDQDLDELAARSAELRDDLVWAHGRIIADDPATVARGEDSDDVVEFIRWRVAQLKEELLIESPYFVLPAGAQATVKALHERGVRVRVLTNSLASNDVLPAHSGYAKTRKRLLENGMELYELRPDTDAFRPGWSLLSKAVAGGPAHQGHGLRPRSRVHRQLQPRPALRLAQHRGRPLHREPGARGKAGGLHGDRRRARQQLPRPPRREGRGRLGDGDGRPDGALPGRARHRLPPALRRRPLEGPADRIAALTPIAGGDRGRPGRARVPLRRSAWPRHGRAPRDRGIHLIRFRDIAVEAMGGCHM